MIRTSAAGAVLDRAKLENGVYGVFRLAGFRRQVSRGYGGLNGLTPLPQMPIKNVGVVWYVLCGMWHDDMIVVVYDIMVVICNILMVLYNIMVVRCDIMVAN